MIILQKHLPFRAWEGPAMARLPGTQPLAGPWIVRDEAFAGQMALRDEYVLSRRAHGVMLDDEAHAAADELLERVLADLRGDPGYRFGERVIRPDGIPVQIDRSDPMGTLARLVQEDLCILEKRGEEHVLTGGVLLFPASWTLGQKFMRPLMGIHEPVVQYDENIGRRVQRMFDTIRPEQPIWRANWLTYRDPDLWQPRSEDDRRPKPAPDTGYLRTERQTIFRLPVTGAVVFAIHTYVLALDDLEPDARESLRLAGQR
jgi:dimethylamine monooxygenase subunit A